MRRNSLLNALVGACAAWLSLAPASEVAAAPVRLRLGVASSLFDAPSLIALEKHYFADQGLEVEVKSFPSAADANQALAIGAIDVVQSGIGPAILNARLRNIDMKIVASAGNNTPGHGDVAVVLRRSLLQSGRYKGPADLRGLKLSTGISAPSQWLAVETARAAGVAENDVKYVSLGIPNTIAAMANGAVDGASVNEPYASVLVEKGQGVRVAVMDQTFPGFPMGYLIYGPALTKANPDAGKRYMAAYLKAVRDYQAAFGPKKTGQNEIVAMLKKYSLPISASTPPLGLPDDLAPSFAFVDRYIDWQVASGNVRQKIDPRTLVDDRFRRAALGLPN